MNYNLKNHGDYYERRFWPMLSASFPNYEIFWQRFIVPLTQRETEGNIQLKEDIDPLLEELAMSHYSVFYHLGVSRKQARAEFFEDTFFHLSAATEMVEQLIFSIAKLLELIEGKPMAVPLAEADFNRDVQKIWDKKYKKLYKRFLETGRAVNHNFHQIDDVVSNLFSQLGQQAMKDYRAWATLRDQVRHYRNTLAHNPRLGHFIDSSTGLRVVPKEDKLSNFRLWSAVHYKWDPRHFIRLEEMVDEYQTALEQKTDSLWQHIINLLQALAASDEYEKMAGGQKEPLRDGPVVAGINGEAAMEQPVMPSGTALIALLEKSEYTSTSGSPGLHIRDIDPGAREENIPADEGEEKDSS